MIQKRIVSVKLKNGKIVTAHYTKECRDVVVHCDDSEFFGTESIDTTAYSVEQDAIWCLKKIIRKKGDEIDG